MTDMLYNRLDHLHLLYAWRLCSVPTWKICYCTPCTVVTRDQHLFLNWAKYHVNKHIYLLVTFMVPYQFSQISSIQVFKFTIFLQFQCILGWTKLFWKASKPISDMHEIIFSLKFFIGFHSFGRFTDICTFGIIWTGQLYRCCTYIAYNC